MSNLWHWLRTPRGSKLRALAFHVHLWTGLLCALYVVMLSATGSLLVYRAELMHALDDPTWVWGQPLPPGVRAVLWIVDLHDDLLLGRDNRFVNGIGSIVVTALLLTGMFVWWPGVRAWRRGLSVRWRSRWPRFTWDVHGAGGMWLLPLLLNWSLTGIYLSLPQQTMVVVDMVWPPSDTVLVRPVDIALEWALMLHFGRWPNPALKALWCAIGLTPAVLGVTGVILWWNRVGRRAVRAMLGWNRTAPMPNPDHRALYGPN